VGYVGEDELSLKLLASLEASQIEELHIKKLDGAANHVLILIDADGERTIVGLTEDRLDQVTIRDVTLTPEDYVVFVLWRNCFLEDLSYAQNIGCKIIVGIEALEEIPQITADICIGSGSDLRGELELERYLQRFDRLVVTHGALGADQYWCEGSEIKTLHQPAIQVDKVIDTTGAGDSFFAGYMKGLVDSPDKIADPMLIGAHWSALAVSSSGSQPPDWSRVVTYL
jgi:sugar/nucleoside kinase (ribokinase family)